MTSEFPSYVITHKIIDVAIEITTTTTTTATNKSSQFSGVTDQPAKVDGVFIHQVNTNCFATENASVFSIGYRKHGLRLTFLYNKVQLLTLKFTRLITQEKISHYSGQTYTLFVLKCSLVYSGFAFPKRYKPLIKTSMPINKMISNSNKPLNFAGVYNTSK